VGVGPGVPHVAPSSPGTLGRNLEVVELGRVPAERARRRRGVLAGGQSRATDGTDEAVATVKSTMPATPTGAAVPFPSSTASTPGRVELRRGAFLWWVER
jgi:hypothetical protein